MSPTAPCWGPWSVGPSAPDSARPDRSADLGAAEENLSAHPPVRSPAALTHSQRARRVGAQRARPAWAGGLLAAVTSARVCFIVDAASFLVSAALTGATRRSMQVSRPARRTRLRADLAEAAAYARHEPRVRTLLFAKSGPSLGNGSLALFPLYATSIFGVGAVGSGLMYAARGLGALSWPLFFGRRSRSPARLAGTLAVAMVLVRRDLRGGGGGTGLPAAAGAACGGSHGRRGELDAVDVRLAAAGSGRDPRSGRHPGRPSSGGECTGISAGCCRRRQVTFTLMVEQSLSGPEHYARHQSSPTAYGAPAPLHSVSR